MLRLDGTRFIHFLARFKMHVIHFLDYFRIYLLFFETYNEVSKELTTCSSSLRFSFKMVLSFLPRAAWITSPHWVYTMAQHATIKAASCDSSFTTYNSNDSTGTAAATILTSTTSYSKYLVLMNYPLLSIKSFVSSFSLQQEEEAWKGTTSCMFTEETLYIIWRRDLKSLTHIIKGAHFLILFIIKLFFLQNHI